MDNLYQQLDDILFEVETGKVDVGVFTPEDIEKIRDNLDNPVEEVYQENLCGCPVILLHRINEIRSGNRLDPDAENFEFTFFRLNQYVSSDVYTEIQDECKKRGYISVSHVNETLSSMEDESQDTTLREKLESLEKKQNQKFDLINPIYQGMLKRGYSGNDDMVAKARYKK